MHMRFKISAQLDVGIHRNDCLIVVKIIQNPCASICLDFTSHVHHPCAAMFIRQINKMLAEKCIPAKMGISLSTDRSDLCVCVFVCTNVWWRIHVVVASPLDSLVTSSIFLCHSISEDKEHALNKYI